MRSLPPARRAAGVVLVLLGASRAPAQTVVRVQSAGLPVPQAEVAAWDAEGRLAAARTDGIGIARLLPVRTVAPGAFLVVRRLGFAPARIEFRGDDSLTVTLRAVPAVLPVLSVEAKTLRCPVPDDTAAARLWAAAASRYSIGTTKLFLGWKGRLVLETVSAEQRGYGSDDEGWATGGGTMMPNTTDRGRILLRQPPPYALFEARRDIGGDHQRWRYAPLEQYAAEHFVSAAFRDRHTMTVLGRSADATIIGFCARDYSDAEIEGELQVGSDSTLRSARWFYRMPHDDEDSGAEATFASTAFEGLQYLVAVRGSSWRRARRGLYNQTRHEKIAWRLGRTLEASTPP